MSMVLHNTIGAALALLAPSSPLSASAGTMPVQRRGDQDAALAARQQGRVLPLREIENRVVPTMRGSDYIGVEFDSAAAVYTLKFLRDGSVIWVTVDGRSGAVLGRAGG